MSALPSTTRPAATDSVEFACARCWSRARVFALLAAGSRVQQAYDHLPRRLWSSRPVSVGRGHRQCTRLERPMRPAAYGMLSLSSLEDEVTAATIHAKSREFLDAARSLHANYGALRRDESLRGSIGAAIRE